MTGRWLQPSKAAERLGVDRAEVDRLIADGVLHLLRVAGDHFAIPEADVAKVLAERADETRPVRQWSRADDPEYWREQADYEPGTPDDEEGEQ